MVRPPSQGESSMKNPVGRILLAGLGSILLYATFPASMLVAGIGTSKVVDRVAAVVNGEVITLSDLRWLMYYRGLAEPEDSGQRRSFLEGLLQQLIEQKLIAAEALQTPGIQISDEQVSERMQAYRGRFQSEDEFQKYLHETDMAVSDLQELIRRQLAVVTFVKVRFEPFIIILPDQIRDYYNNVLLPELEETGQQVPPLSLVEEQIRDILTIARVNQEMDSWVRNTLRKASVDVLLFDEGPVSTNLPESQRLDTTMEPVLKPRSQEPPS